MIFHTKWIEKMQKIFSFIESKKGGTISLIVIYLVFVLFSIFFIIPSAYGPVHYGDESRYWNMALSISKGTFTLSDFHHHPLL